MNHGIESEHLEEAVSGPDRRPSAGKRGERLRRIPTEIPIFIFFALVAIFFTWPLVARFTRSIYGIPGDNLGTIWQFWWFRNAASFGAKASFSPLIGFPFGSPAISFTLEPVSDLIHRFLLLFLNEVAVYNLLTISSFFLSGITMYYLVRHLTRDRWAALFGGLAFSISSYHIIQSQMFVNIAQIQWMPVYILALVVFMKKPSGRNAFLLCLSAIIVIGTCIHYGLFMMIFTAAFLLGRFSYGRLHARKQIRKGLSTRRAHLRINRTTLTLCLVIVLVVVVFFAPFFYRFLNPPQAENNWPTSQIPGDVRSQLMAKWGSALPLDYAAPNASNPLLGGISKRIPGSLRSSLYGDTQSVGWVIIALAVLALVVTRDRFGSSDGPARPGEGDSIQTAEAGGSDADSSEHNEDRSMIWGFAAAGTVAFILSMPPYFNLGSRKIPLPSIVLRPLVPWFRWYNRLSVVVGLCAIVIACYGLSWLLARIKRIPKEVVFLALLAFLVFESLSTPVFKTFEFGKTPGVYRRLAEMPAGTSLVLYPLYEPAYFYTSRYLFYQRQFKKPVLNGAPGETDGETLRRTVYNPFNPDTPGILRRFDIRYVVYLSALFPKYKGKESGETLIKRLPSGLRLEKRVPDKDIFGDALILKVTSPRAAFVPLYQGNISVPHIVAGQSTARLMKRDGLIKILNFTGRRTSATVEIPVENITVRQRVSVIRDNKVISSGYINKKQSSVIRLTGVSIPKGGTDLIIYAEGPQVPIDTTQISSFGFERANLRIGDVRVIPEVTGIPR